MGKAVVQNLLPETEVTVPRTSTTIFVLLLLIPFASTIVYGGVDTGSWVILMLVGALVASLWLTQGLATGQIELGKNVLVLPLIGLILIGLIQIIPVFSGGTISLDPYSTRLFVVRLCVYAIFFAAAITFINSERRIKIATIAVIIFGTLLAFFAILQRLANPEAIYGLREARQAIPFGPFVNQHHFAAFMEMTAALTFALLFSSAVKRNSKVFLGIAAVIMGVACILTSSRGGLLSFAAGFVFVIFLTFFKTKDSRTPKVKSYSLVAIAGVSIAVLMVAIVLYVGGNDSLLRGIGMSGTQADVTNGRFHFWGIAVQIFLDHPILGAGLDAFGVAFPKYDTWTGIFRVEQAHNDYLQTLADSGVAGIICVGTFIGLLFRNGLQTIKFAENGLRKAFSIGALGGCFAILIHSFVDFPLRTPSNAFFFLLLAAIATISIRNNNLKVA